jgi:hypothetical protein
MTGALQMKILLCLRPKLVMTTLVGVVPLHGGIYEECQRPPLLTRDGVSG